MVAGAAVGLWFAAVPVAVAQDGDAPDAEAQEEGADQPAAPVTPPPTVQPPQRVVGLGTMSCLAITRRFNENFRFYQSLGLDSESAYWTTFQGMLHWAQGYMSHRNLALDQTGGRVADLQPDTFDHGQQLEFLRDWCIGNPNLSFQDAVEALYASLAYARIQER